MTLELTAAVRWLRLCNDAFMIRLPKFGVQLLSFYKPVNGLRQPTNASMEQPVECKMDVGPIGRMTDLECHQLAITPTELADIIIANEAKGYPMIEELRMRVAGTESLYKRTTVGASRENGAVADIKRSVSDQRPVKLKKE